MSTPGLSSSGFYRKRLNEIISDLEDALKLAFGDNIDLSAQSGFGQFVGIMSEQLADEWQSQENIYNSQYPSTAQGNQLSNVVMYNGLTRLAASYSTIATVTLTGISGTLIPAGSQASVTGTGKVFETDSAATIGVGGTVVVSMTATETGAIEASIGTLVNIDTPIYGWTAVNNTVAAVAGRDVETDAELRVRRASSTLFTAQNLSDSLYAQLLQVDNVDDVLVFSNGTGGVVNGVPAHNFLTVVRGGDDDDIAAVVWTNTPQGIASYGTTTVSVTDAQGYSQDVKFTRPSPINIYFTVTITTDSDFPSTGSDDIKAAMVAYGQANFLIDDDVIMSEFYTPINTIPGITSIVLTIGTAPTPVGTANITIDIDEYSNYDPSYIGVTIV